MQVGSRRAAGVANDTDRLPTRHTLANRHIHAVEMPVERAIAILMVDDDRAGGATVVGISGEHHFAIGSRQCSFRRRCGVIPPVMTVVRKDRVGFHTSPVGSDAIAGVAHQERTAVVEEGRDRNYFPDWTGQEGFGEREPVIRRDARVVEQVRIDGAKSFHQSRKTLWNRRGGKDARQGISGERHLFRRRRSAAVGEGECNALRVIAPCVEHLADCPAHLCLQSASSSVVTAKPDRPRELIGGWLRIADQAAVQFDERQNDLRVDAVIDRLTG